MFIRKLYVRKNAVLFLFAMIILLYGGQGISYAQNNAPVFTDGDSTTRSIAENTDAGQNIGTAIAATDVDGDPLTYTLSGTTDAPNDYEAFDIVSTSGQLQTKDPLDFETQRSYEMTVTVNDGTDTDTIIVTITITNVIETPVCDRTSRVRNAIVAAVPGITDCADVTETHLAAITSLDVKQAGSLKSGDFEGLTGLTELDLSHNGLSTLPQDLFEGLTALEELSLSSNPLTTLDADLFDGLTSLETLILSNNLLRTLDADVFEGLTALKTLILSVNRLSTLDVDLFDGLAALETLRLGDNSFSTLDANIFDGLTALTEIDLNDNDLSALPAGIFEGLTALTKLDLSGNMVDLTLTVSLTKVSDGEFKATVDTGAPFDIVLPITVANGSIDGSATTVTIPTGSLESSSVNVTRTTGTTAGVTVDIRMLPSLPSRHLGYALIKSTALPVTVINTVGNSAPEFPATTDTTLEIAENTAPNENIGAAVSATDTDSGDTLTYSLGGTDGDSFNIITAGQLQTKISLDYEMKNTYSVIVSVSDGSDTAYIDVTISITDVNESPVFPDTTDTTLEVEPNRTVGANIGRAVTAIDPDTADGDTDVNPTDATVDSLTYSLGGDDAASFDFNTTTGQLIAKEGVTFDRSVKSEYTVTVTVTDGEFTVEIEVTITVGVMPVCDRTSAVRDAIVAAVSGVTKCRDVTEAHLATITDLDLTFQRITELKSGDFEGLSALTVLRLDNNQLTSLPEDVFSGLSSLEWILLSNNQLTSLPEDVFSGLSSLEWILLRDNDLTSLPEGVFSGLSALTSLWLDSNPLTSLPEGVFSGLSALTGLWLHNNQLTSLPEGVFSGLSALISLQLDGNDLTFLPEGVFSGLSALTGLWLNDNDLTFVPKGIFSGLPLTALRLNDNDLTSLPNGVFSGLSALRRLYMQQNAVDPLLLIVSLKKVADGEFKATVHTGAPFDIVLPITVSNGSIDSGATTITIPAGSLESSSLTVTRTPGTMAAVTVNIGTLPSLPADHEGYALKKSSALPTTVISTVGNNAPEFTEGYSTTRTVAENTAAGEDIGAEVEATDDDMDSLTYSLDADADVVFDIDSSSGQLETSAALDFEAQRFYIVVVSVSDDTDTVSITVTVNITNVNETPLFPDSTDTTLEVSKYTPAGTNIGAPITAVDPDSGDTLTYSLGGDDAASFDFDMTTGQLITKDGVTFDKAVKSEYTVTVTVTDGEFTVETEVTITVGVMPVCDRTLQVRNAIVSAVSGVSDCADVTETHLAAITSLDLSYRSVPTLKAGDFDGLTALTTLYMDYSYLSALDADVFDGLTALTALYMSGNDLSALPEDVFDGLTALTELSLDFNDLSALPEDVFDGLTALTTLWVNSNDLSSLPADVFDGLTALTTLWLNDNGLSSLPADVFDGLTALTTLHLHFNDLSALDADVFDGLTALTGFSLRKNRLSTLPAGIFEGLTMLGQIDLSGNTVDPLPVTVSLKKVADGEFKAAVDTGAPFELVLPVTVSNGSIDGSATTITIPAGSVESSSLTVTRTTGTTAAVTANIGTLPDLPSDHDGYALVKSTALPLTVIDAAPPTVTIRVPDSTQTGAFDVTVVFSAAVTGFVQSELVVSGAGASITAWNPQTGGAEYKATITPTQTGTAIFNVAAGVAEHSSKQNLAATQQTVQVDMTAPTVSITVPTGVQNAPFDVTVVFSEAVTGFVQSELVVSGTSGSSITSWNPQTGGAEYKATITPTQTGTAIFNVAANVAKDVVEYQNTAAPQQTVDVNLGKPVVSISVPSGVQNSAFEVTVGFSEAVTGFDQSELVVSGAGASITAWNPQVGGRDYKATITPTQTGTVTLDVAAEVAEDTGGNLNTVASQQSVDVNLGRPGVSISVPSGVQNSAFNVTVVFDEAVTGFAQSELVVSGSASASITSWNPQAGGAEYRATITPTETGTVTLDVAAGVAEDTGKNKNTAATQQTVDVNLGRPTVSISAPSDPQNGAFTVTVEFSESVTGFVQGDISLSGTATASVSNFSGSGDTYTFTITPTTDGDVHIDVAANVAQDSGSNQNRAATRQTVQIDMTAPTVSISVPSAVQNAPFVVTVVFSEPVTGFVQSELVVSGAGASITGWTPRTGGAEYRANITPTGTGTALFNVAANVAQDSATNQNTAATQQTVQVNLNRPTVRIDVPSGLQTGAFDVTVVFNELVTGFVQSELVVSGTSGSSITSWNPQTGGTDYKATITPSRDGTAIFNVAANVAADSGNNPNTAATQQTVQVDVTAPTVHITVPSDPQNGAFGVTVEFSESVTGFVQGDISLSGTATASVSNFSGSGSTYTFTITPSTEGDVHIDVAAGVAEDIASHPNTAATQQTVQVDMTVPTVSIDVPSGLQTRPFNITITFSEPVFGFTREDISLSGARANATNFTRSGSTYTARINPTANGDVVIQVEAGVAEDAAGNLNTASGTQTVSVDVVSYPDPFLFVSQNGVAQTDQTVSPGTFAFIIDFGEVVTGFEQTDISIRPAGATIIVWQVSEAGERYTATIRVATAGSFTLSVPANVAHALDDGVGNLGSKLLVKVEAGEAESNRAPVFASNSVTRSVAEHSKRGTAIGAPVTATDPDEDVLIYLLIAHNDAPEDYQAFSVVSGTGQLTVKSELDYETKNTYKVVVKAYDGRGGADTIAVTIIVTNVRETLPNTAPVFASDTTTRSIAENTPANRNIGSPVSATDQDNDTLTYSLSDTDAGSFRIVSSTGQLRTHAVLDFESKRTYSVRVNVADGRGGTDFIDVTINVTDVDERPSNRPPGFARESTTRAIGETTRTGMKIGAPVSATDPDKDTLIYSLEGTDAASFRIDSGTGQLKTKVALNRNVKNQYTVTVKVDDGRGGTDTITVTINVVEPDRPEAIMDVRQNGVPEWDQVVKPGTFQLRMGFDQAVTNFERSDIDIHDFGTGATITGWQKSADSKDYTATIRANSVGAISFTVPENAAEAADDGQGNVETKLTVHVTNSGEFEFGAPVTQKGTSPPANTQLLTNHPNPANPETYIPYRLAKPADVTLTIYNIRGVVVRILAVGHQPAGYYTNRSRAIHWDSKNEFGERVATGLYFYQLKAGDYTAMRKMLIRK